MASGIYTYFKAHVMDAEYDLPNDTVKVALLDNNHSFTATDDGWADVSANEVSGTGYSAGGGTLANCAVSIDDGDAEGVFDADNYTWANSTITAYHGVVYDDTHASDALICSIDFSGAQSSVSGDFTIQWAAEGIVNIS